MTTEPIVALLRRYCVDYVLRHDVEVIDEILTPSFVQSIGGRCYAGRDGQYKSSVTRAFRRFPTLGFTVHDVVTDGEHIAMHFTEHGTSAALSLQASWAGIGIYRWDGHRFVENWSEQDRYARRCQLAGDPPNPVEPPGIDPWSRRPGRRNPGAEERVRALLQTADLDGIRGGVFDDDWIIRRGRAIVKDARMEINALFSADEAVAFHVTWSGGYGGGFAGYDAQLGTPIVTSACGIVRLHDGEVVSLRAITDRERALHCLGVLEPDPLVLAEDGAGSVDRR